MSRLALLLALLAALVLTACGSDESGGGQASGRGNAERLLQRGFSTDVDSGKLALSVQLTLYGSNAHSLHLDFEGPFRVRRPTDIPELDWSFDAGIDRQSAAGRVVALPDDVYVVYEGEPYALGADAWAKFQRELGTQNTDDFGALGIDPRDWITDLRAGDRQRLGGVQTTTIHGTLDVGQLLADLDRSSAAADGDTRASLSKQQLEQVQAAVDKARFSASIGDDGIWRSLSITAPFTLPEAVRGAAGRIDGGMLRLRLELDDPNTHQRIQAPPGDPEPITNLLQALGLPTERLGIAPPASGS